MNEKSSKYLFEDHDHAVLQAILAHSSEGFCLLNEGGVILDLNPAFSVMMGYDEAELVGMNIKVLVPPDRKPVLLPKLQKGQDADAQVQLVHKNGSLVHADVKARVVKQAKDTLFLGVITDITSQAVAEKASRESEEKYQILFNSEPNPIVIHNGKEILEVNRATLHALNLRHKSEIIGKNPLDLIAPEDKERAQLRLNAMEKEERVDPEEFVINLPNGEQRIVIASPTLVEYEGETAFMVNYRDITDRQATREALVRSKDFAENLMETANTLVVVLDPDAKITMFNKFAEDLTGYKKSEVLGKNWVKTFIPQRDQDFILQLFSALVEQSPKAAKNENGIVTKSGEERLVSWNNTVLRSGDGNLSGVLSIGLDITESKAAEEALKTSEEHYRNVVQDQTEYIMRYTPDAVITFVNDSYCREFNIRFEEAVGKNLLSNKLAPEIKRIKNKIATLTVDNPINIDEHISTKQDGEEAWHLWVDRGIFDNEGRLQEVQAVGRDITERKQMEESLRTSTTQLEEAQRLAKVGAYTYDIMNDSWESSPVLSEIFGIPSAYTKNMESWLNLVHPEDREGARNYLETCVVERRPEFNTEYRILRHSDQALHWVHGIGRFVYDDDGSALRMIGVIQDITSRKLSEADREKALVEARTANQVKDQFIANISHEIRTPLNSILGFSDILHQRYKSALRKNDINIFDYINNASGRLMRTVDSILNISQLEAGILKVFPREIDLVSISKTVLEETRAIAEEKGLQILLDSKLKTAVVHADEYCVHQAVANLVENAIKFTSKGSVQIIVSSQDKDTATVSIEDTGIGISKEYRDRIYEPYTQESEGFTKDYQGVGLGMALTKRYAELNDIQIKLKSKPGIGTTFTLLFNLKKGSAHGRK